MAELLRRASKLPASSMASMASFSCSPRIQRIPFDRLFRPLPPSNAFKGRGYKLEEGATASLRLLETYEPVLNQMLSRDWLLSSPDSSLFRIVLPIRSNGSDVFSAIKETRKEGIFSSNGDEGVFWILRDDLLHPLMGGNKLRKLDALLPLLEANNVTDVLVVGDMWGMPKCAYNCRGCRLCRERNLGSFITKGRTASCLHGIRSHF